MTGRLVAALAGAVLLSGALASGGSAGAAGPVFVGPTGRQIALTSDDLAKLPSVRLHVSFLTEHGTSSADFAGPLLWDVLVRAGAVDPGKPRGTAREIIVVTGADGYIAALAIGEISPAFEDKQVILADEMDGKPLTPGHLRIVVPLDRHGGRSVRDVVRIAVAAAATKTPDR